MSDYEVYDDAAVLIAGVLYDEDGWEAEPVRLAGSVVCAGCGDEADAEPGSPCGRDLSEERGLPDGSVLCCGVYHAV